MMLHSRISRGATAGLVGMMLCWAGLRASPSNEALSAEAVAAAAMAEDRAAVRSLLKQGANVNGAQGDGMTALHWAGLNGDSELVKVLLSAGANVAATTRIDEETPLHLAAKSGDAAAVVLLSAAGADVNDATAAGTTPLMLAARAGNPAVVRALLARGANPNAAESAKRHTALMFAAAANRAEVVKVLLEGGATATATTAVFDLTEVEIPADRPALLNAVTKAQREKAEAARRNDPNAKPLIAGVSRSYTENELVAAQGGLTPLLLAARQGYRESAAALLDAGVDINQPSAGVAITPLAIAIVNGHFDLAIYLLERGADPNLAADNGVTPLYAALNCQWSPKADYPQPLAHLQQATSHLALMTALLDKGANPNARLRKKVWYSGYTRDLSDTDETGATAFWRAAYAYDLEAMRLLMSHGADPAMPTTSARPPFGLPNETPLHAAIAYHIGARSHPAGWRRAVDYLVDELHADVNARDHDGNTPMHFAAARGSNDIVRYLVSKGGDATVVNKKGQTTVDLANGPEQRVQPYPETIALLESLGAKNNHKCVSC